MASPGATATAAGPEKLKEVTELVAMLTEDLKDVTLLPKQRDAALEKLKLYGREQKDADPIFTKEGIAMLLKHAFYSPSSQTSYGALRVLGNALLLKPETRQFVVDEGFAPRACEALKTDSWENEFLISRILFLLTYGTDVNLPELIDKNHLAERISDNLGRHAKLLTSKSKEPVELLETMALIETSKLMFNVTHFCPEHKRLFTSAGPHLVAMLFRRDVPASRPLDTEFGPIINALLNVDLAAEKCQNALFPGGDGTKVCSRLVQLLDVCMSTYPERDLEAVVTPVISLLALVHENAPEEPQKFLRKSLLPTAEDRQSILGRGQSLTSRLLKNSTNPTAPALRDAISHLLFDLSDKDANKFVENVGYGFASGFLFQNNVPIPQSAKEAFSTSDASGSQRPVNPITGQFIDLEKFANEPEMTQEEKEREAEKLFVLFERLKKNGIIDVQNPVEKAVQEGRFEELDDDAEDVD